MENTEKKTKKFLIYIPLIIAGALCVAEIFERVAAYLAYNGELELSESYYVFNWRLFAFQFLACLLPVCLIFFNRKKTGKFNKILVIACFIMVVSTLILGIFYVLQWRAYYKDNGNVNTIILLITIISFIPGAGLFENIFLAYRIIKVFFNFLCLGNTIFVAAIAMKLSKTENFTPKPSYQPLSAWQGIKSFAGSPAALASWKLILNQPDNAVLLKLQLKNTGARSICAVKINVNCYDAFKTLLGTCQNILMDIAAAPGMLINTGCPIVLPYNQTRSIEIVLKSVSFTDGSVWQNDANSLFEQTAQAQ